MYIVGIENRLLLLAGWDFILCQRCLFENLFHSTIVPPPVWDSKEKLGVHCFSCTLGFLLDFRILQGVVYGSCGEKEISKGTN